MSETTPEPELGIPLPPVDPQHVRIAEALLFAAAEPLDLKSIARRLPDDADVRTVLATLVQQYAGRGVTLKEVAERWAFYTAGDLAYLLEDRREVQRKLSRAAIETLAIIAYHQPVTRTEIEELRGVALSKGTLDVLLETGWIRLRGRRKTPGRPVTYGTTDDFLIHFGLERLDDLPGVEELRAAGLLDPALIGADGLPQPGQSLPDREEEPLDAEDDGSDFRPAVDLDETEPATPATEAPPEPAAEPGADSDGEPTAEDPADKAQAS